MYFLFCPFASPAFPFCFLKIYTWHPRFLGQKLLKWRPAEQNVPSQDCGWRDLATWIGHITPLPWAALSKIGEPGAGRDLKPSVWDGVPGVEGHTGTSVFAGQLLGSSEDVNSQTLIFLKYELTWSAFCYLGFRPSHRLHFTIVIPRMCKLLVKQRPRHSLSLQGSIPEWNRLK